MDTAVTLGTLTPFAAAAALAFAYKRRGVRARHVRSDAALTWGLVAALMTGLTHGLLAVISFFSVVAAAITITVLGLRRAR